MRDPTAKLCPLWGHPDPHRYPDASWPRITGNRVADIGRSVLWKIAADRPSSIFREADWPRPCCRWRAGRWKSRVSGRHREPDRKWTPQCHVTPAKAGVQGNGWSPWALASRFRGN